MAVPGDFESALDVVMDVFDHCAEMVRRHDPDRFLSALFAPEKPRRGLLALYAFDLELAGIRDRVTEPMLGEIRLTWWREAVETIFAGATPHGPMAQALACAVAEAGLERAAFDALIDARQGELYGEPMTSRAALDAYVVATGSGVMGLAAAILAPNPADKPALAAAALEGGHAWALTGLLRALPAQARRGQVRLPADLIEPRASQPTALGADRTPDLPRDALLWLVTDARRALDRARKALAVAACAQALPAFLPLALVDPYLRPVLQNIEKARDPTRLGVSIPVYRRQLYLLIAALRGRV